MFSLIKNESQEIGRAHVWTSSHDQISYAVFCLKKKKKQQKKQKKKIKNKKKKKQKSSDINKTETYK